MALEEKWVYVDYTNWKGERRIRRIMPVSLKYGATPYHSPYQWLLEAVDIDDGHKWKFFALSGFHRWSDKPLEPYVEPAIPIEPVAFMPPPFHHAENYSSLDAAEGIPQPPIV